MSDFDSGQNLTRRSLMAGVTLALTVPTYVGAKAYSDTRVDLLRLSTPSSAEVATKEGRVRGFQRGGVYIFRGIPYGTDTGGSARFKPAQRVPAWEGTRSALNYGPVCPQPIRDRSNDMVAFICDWDDGYPSEDCLRVNVWSMGLEPGARRPVMLWLHGGGFTAGSSQELPTYDGEQLARHGVVVMSVNHRLGPLGYLDVSNLDSEYGASGNVGMLDLVLALEWVRDNAKNFGGDPDRVTIFGQSGGGAKVSVLMSMPRAKGLFHRAIVMSGSFAAGSTPAAAQESQRGLSEELGAQPSISALQQVDASALMAASLRLSHRESSKRTGGTRLGWAPVVDGHVFPEDWQSTAPRLSAHIPLMIGTVRDEIPAFQMPSREAELVPTLQPHFGAQTGALITAVRGFYPGLDAHATAATINGLAWRARALDQARKQHALGGSAVYSYWYVWPSPLLDGNIGCPHGSDLTGAFDNVARNETLTGNSPDAQAIAQVMAPALVAFATNGNPSTPNQAWPAFDPEAAMTMMFDRRIRVESHPLAQALQLLPQAT